MSVPPAWTPSSTSKPSTPPTSPNPSRTSSAAIATSRSTFPRNCPGSALPYFLDWLIENVHLVEITAYSDEDAYTIFETMNDRGLPLSPTDMLKGFLLANIDRQQNASGERLLEEAHLGTQRAGKEADSDCFKTWLRASTRQDSRTQEGSGAEDFDLIGTEFHRWVRDQRADRPQGERRLLPVHRPRLPVLLPPVPAAAEAAEELVPGPEHVLYNAHHGFTLQYMLLLAPLSPRTRTRSSGQTQARRTVSWTSSSPGGSGTSEHRVQHDALRDVPRHAGHPRIGARGAGLSCRDS